MLQADGKIKGGLQLDESWRRVAWLQKECVRVLEGAGVGGAGGEGRKDGLLGDGRGGGGKAKTGDVGEDRGEEREEDVGEDRAKGEMGETSSEPE